MVFFFELSSAECTPRVRARSKMVGASRSFASSMYSSVPVAGSKYELPITPCSEGQTPQQIEALLVFVTLGMTARARAWIPRAAQALQRRHRAAVVVFEAEAVAHDDDGALRFLRGAGNRGAATSVAAPTVSEACIRPRLGQVLRMSIILSCFATVHTSAALRARRDARAKASGHMASAVIAVAIRASFNPSLSPSMP